MPMLRHTPIALALLSLYSAPILANETQETDDRMNVLISKGHSAPNATTQNYSGDTVIKIVPSNTDINKSLDELIAENSPGFVNTNSGTSKHNSNNYHRGLSDKYTLYLLNGVAFPTSTLGSQNVPDIPIESIELIEVIRGAQASLYGSSSLTGVINIITKTGATSDAQLNISTGTHNTNRIGGVYADNFGSFQLMTSLEVDESDGYDFIEASDDDFGYQTYSMNSYAAYVTESNRFSLAINNARSDIEIYDTYNPVHWMNPPGKAESTQEYYQFTGKYIQRLSQNITSEFTLSHANTDLESGHYNATNIDNYATQTNLGQLHLNSQWDKLSVNLGGELIKSEYDSNENSAKREQRALYLAMSSDITEDVNISGGLRNDNYSDFGNALTYSAGISLFKTASLSYNTSFTAPSYNDLYWPGQGNPDLESEEGKMLELSLTHNIDTKSAHIPIKLNFYKGLVDNKIDWAPIAPGSSVWLPFNIGEVELNGVEAYMQYNASSFVFDIAGAYSESIDKSTNKQLNNVPEWSGSSSFQYNVTNSIKPKIIYSYIGERMASSGELDAVHLLDFAINYQVMKNISVGFNINNITDNDQQLHDGYNADGRTYLLSVGANM
jgi:vitamin B12 transporter